MKKLHKVMICWEPPIADSAWMLMARVVEVPASESEIVERRYVEVPDEAMYALDDAMGWTEYLAEDWPAPVLN